VHGEPRRDGRELAPEAGPQVKAGVRTPEVERSVGLAIDLISLFVDRAVVATTKQREIRQRCRAAMRPVADVMALTESRRAAWKAATSVAMVERAS